MIRTRFTEPFGLDSPIMSAPMARVTGASLAASETAAAIVRTLCDEASTLLRHRLPALLDEGA